MFSLTLLKITPALLELSPAPLGTIFGLVIIISSHLSRFSDILKVSTTLKVECFTRIANPSSLQAVSLAILTLVGLTSGNSSLSRGNSGLFSGLIDHIKSNSARTRGIVSLAQLGVIANLVRKFSGLA